MLKYNEKQHHRPISASIDKNIDNPLVQDIVRGKSISGALKEFYDLECLVYDIERTGEIWIYKTVGTYDARRDNESPDNLVSFINKVSNHNFDEQLLQYHRIHEDMRNRSIYLHTRFKIVRKITRPKTPHLDELALLHRTCIELEDFVNEKYIPQLIDQHIKQQNKKNKRTVQM